MSVRSIDNATEAGDLTATAQMLRRQLRSYAAKVGDSEPADLAEMVALAEEFQAAVKVTAQTQRSVWGWSWAQIGAALGTSKQAAQQRFGR